MRSLWTAESSAPFIADPELSDSLFDSARRVARQHSIDMLLMRFPTLGVWAVLYPLSKNYTAKDQGGRLSNLVADRADFTCDIRLPVGVSVEDIETEITPICEATDDVDLQIARRYEPSWTAPDHPVIEKVRRNCAAIPGGEPAVTMRVGASDARLYRYAGVPSVVCGLMAYNLGAPDEHVMLDELHALVDIFALSAHDYLVSNA